MSSLYYKYRSLSVKFQDDWSNSTDYFHPPWTGYLLNDNAIIKFSELVFLPWLLLFICTFCFLASPAHQKLLKKNAKTSEMWTFNHDFDLKTLQTIIDIRLPYHSFWLLWRGLSICKFMTQKSAGIMMNLITLHRYTSLCGSKVEGAYQGGSGKMFSAT